MNKELSCNGEDKIFQYELYVNWRKYCLNTELLHWEENISI